MKHLFLIMAVMVSTGSAWAQYTNTSGNSCLPVVSRGVDAMEVFNSRVGDTNGILTGALEKVDRATLRLDLLMNTTIPELIELFKSMRDEGQKARLVAEKGVQVVEDRTSTGHLVATLTAAAACVAAVGAAVVWGGRYCKDHMCAVGPANPPRTSP